MSTLSNTLDIKIEHPEQWRLSLCIDRKRIRLIAYSDIEKDSLISRSVELKRGEEDFLKALESCVYDNPFFLYDFKQVRVAISSMRYMFVPEEISDNERLTKESFATLYGASGEDGEGTSEIVVDKLRNCNAAVAFDVPKGVVPFLNRTFHNPPIRHHLSALCEYFATKNILTSVGSEYVYMHDNVVDILVFKKNTFAYANSFEYHTSDDILFYALSVWNEYSMDALNDELQIAGDKNTKEVISPILKNYITYVLPIVFPLSAIKKISQDSVKAPFDLILMSLCE